MPKLIANRKFPYAGRDLEPEEEFEASNQDALILTRCANPPAREVSEKPKRRYQRRDMQAQE